MKQLNVLLDYQKLDIKIGKIENEVKESPLYKKVMKVRKYLLDSQKLMKKHEEDIDEINEGLKSLLSQYNECNETIEEISKALESVSVESSIKEAQMLLRNANQEKAKLVKIEKEIIKDQARITKIEESLQKIVHNVPTYKAEFDQLKEKYDAELLEVNKTAAPLKEELKELSKNIEKDLLKKYKTAKKSHPIAVVKLDGKRCMGCNMELSSKMAKEVSTSDTLMECENCGRLLYVADK
ncbi:MAG: C4-type zinc ribbon domain-containing protein [Eubacteriales bacterium]